MKKLKSRGRQIPNGLTFLQPETGWRPRKNSSFEGIVQALMTHRLGNPALKAKGLPVDRIAIEREVETFNVKLCEKMGWNDYLAEASVGGAPPTFFQRRAVRNSSPPTVNPSEQNVVAAKIKNIWSGVKTLNEWIDSGEPAVPATLSAQRAAVCVGCPKNTPGDFTAWFTKPASEAIKKQMEKLQDRKLTTPSDDQIQVCSVCLCPLKLKVHTPATFIKTHTNEDTLNQLRQVPNCWVAKEINA